MLLNVIYAVTFYKEPVFQKQKAVSNICAKKLALNFLK